MPYDQYLRNLIIAAGNSREKRYVEILTKILLNGAENLRVHAIWALGEIAHDDCLKILQVQFDGESSQLVKNEILYTLNKLT